MKDSEIKYKAEIRLTELRLRYCRDKTQKGHLDHKLSWLKKNRMMILKYADISDKRRRNKNDRLSKDMQP